MAKIKIKGNKVTQQEVENCIKLELYMKMGEKISICHFTLVDGHEVIGHSGVVDPRLFNSEIGNKIARSRAIDEVWRHLGSVLQDRKSS